MIPKTMNASQVDELRAMQSIFDESVSVFVDDVIVSDIDALEHEGDNPVDTVFVVVVINLDSADGVAVSLEHAGEEVGTCGTVTHLPPVQFQATYNPSQYLIYGSSNVISLRISACWMIGQAASIKTSLEHELKDLVAGTGAHEPVLFAACGHVRQRLESVRALIYSAEDPSKMHRFLLAFNISRRNELFDQKSHECGLCFELKDGARFVRLECGHAFCAECARRLVSSCIRSCDVHVKCPDTSCRELLQPHEIKEIAADDEIFDIWTDLSFKHGIANDPDFGYCPRCGGIAIEDTEENCADCSVCFWVFCTLCQESRHPGVDCVSAETKLEMLRQKAAGGSADAIAALRKKEQELKSLSLIEKTSKFCPSCGEAVQKTEGCNKMTCVCGSLFCWRCGDQVHGYDHFKEGGNCVLFDEAEIMRWERQFGMMMVGGGHDDGPVAGRMAEPNNGNEQVLVPRNQCAVCPCCRQLSYRVAGNNHLRCWSCRQWFCGACHKLLDRGGGRTHFGPSGCPQHARW
jgi:hypothetical protein